MKTMAKFFLAVLGVAILSGCAVLNKNVSSTEQVWELNSLKDVSLDEIETLTAISIPINPMWIGDGLGVYTLVQDKSGKEVQKLQRRLVWTTLVCDEKKCDSYPAVINKFGTRLFMLGLGKKKEDLQEKQLAVLSGSRRKAMVKGEVVDIETEKVITDVNARADFFSKHSHRITPDMLINLNPDTAAGQKFLNDLKKDFPEEVVIDGRLVSASGDFTSVKNLVGMNNNATAINRILDASNMKVSVQSVLFPYYELVRFVIVAGLAASDDTLKGSFFEARVTGAQAGEALSVYLANCQQQVEKLQNENNILYRKIREVKP